MVKGLDHALGKDFVFLFCAGHFQAPCDIFPCALQVQWLNVIAGADSLQQGPAPGLAQFFVQFRLPCKEDIDQFFISGFHIREEPNLFKKFEREFMGLIYNKNEVFLVLEAFFQEVFKFYQKCCF